MKGASRERYSAACCCIRYVEMDKMSDYKEHDCVILAIKLPEKDLKEDSLGAIVDIYTNPRLAYEVEFMEKTDQDWILITLTPDQVLPYKPT
jgi:hypothetical protein